MTRGIIITSNCSMHETPGVIDFSGGIKPEKLRQFITYWDKILCVDSHIFNGFRVEFFPEIVLLEKENLFTQKIVNIPGYQHHGLDSMFFSRPIAQRIAYEELSNCDDDTLWTLGQNGNILVVPENSDEKMDVLQITLENCLPVPTCPIDKLLELKQKRRAEFLNFQSALDEMKERICNAENKKNAIIMEKEKIEKSLLDLHKVIDETKTRKVLNSIKTYTNIENNNFLSTLFPVVGAVSANRFSVSPELGALIGMGVNASINLLIKKETKFDNVHDSLKPFAYLLHVENLK